MKFVVRFAIQKLKARRAARCGKLYIDLTPQIVVGIENDSEGTGLSHHRDWNSLSVGLPLFGTGRARAGLSVMDQRLLLYGTAGLATGQLNDAAIKKIKMGRTAGGGAEYAITPKWSGKLEYLYMDFKHDALPNWNNPKFHTVRLGVNYHFDPFWRLA
jgi:outer membrane immunogenic protein